MEFLESESDDLLEAMGEPTRPAAATQGIYVYFSMEEKEEEDEKSDMTLRIQKPNEVDMWFRISGRMPLRHVMRYYCNHVGLVYEQVRITYDGKKIKDTQTALQLHMEDDDVIDAWTDLSTGGRGGGGGGGGAN